MTRKNENIQQGRYLENIAICVFMTFSKCFPFRSGREILTLAF